MTFTTNIYVYSILRSYYGYISTGMCLQKSTDLINNHSYLLKKKTKGSVGPDQETHCGVLTGCRFGVGHARICMLAEIPPPRRIQTSVRKEETRPLEGLLGVCCIQLPVLTRLCSTLPTPSCTSTSHTHKLYTHVQEWRQLCFTPVEARSLVRLRCR